MLTNDGLQFSGSAQKVKVQNRPNWRSTSRHEPFAKGGFSISRCNYEPASSKSRVEEGLHFQVWVSIHHFVAKGTTHLVSCLSRLCLQKSPKNIVFCGLGCNTSPTDQAQPYCLFNSMQVLLRSCGTPAHANPHWFNDVAGGPSQPHTDNIGPLSH